jgi:biotin transport system substrate-specific component
MNSVDQNQGRQHNRALSTTDISFIALFTAIMAVCSWISVPAAVPFTLQTFAVFLTTGLLGGRRGTIAVVLYILLGAAGVPVFSGFTGGPGHLFGPTGGYIFGFIFTALVMWLIEYRNGRSLPVLAFSMAAGLLICYAVGTEWFVFEYTRSNDPVSFMTALSWCVIPYIIPDALKIVLAVVLTRRLRPHLPL